MDWTQAKFESVKLHPYSTGFRLDWHLKYWGFGTILFTVGENGEVDLDSEYMSKDFVKAALAALVDSAVD